MSQRFEMENVPAFNPVHILLIEDDASTEQAVIEDFSACRIANRIRVVRTLDEALEILREGSLSKPCMILLDWERFASGWKAFRAAMQDDPCLEKAPVVLLVESEEPVKEASSGLDPAAGCIRKDRAGEDFMKLISICENIWKIVEAPVGD
ncbi:MAG: response regulator [Planctomycetota bacterium]|jgi:CheY-like chemotaxis protein